MLTLSIDGHQHRVVFSHIYPTLERLCDVLSDAWTGSSWKHATFLEEPAEVDATFRPMPDGRCRVSFLRFPTMAEPWNRACLSPSSTAQQKTWSCGSGVHSDACKRRCLLSSSLLVGVSRSPSPRWRRSPGSFPTTKRDARVALPVS
jgi:hypothetical protein